jgi:translation initiation factor 1
VAKTIEYWQIGAGDEGLIDQQVMDLVARLLGGGARPAGDKKKPGPPAKPAAPKPVVLKVGRETAGRHGKGVTTIFDTPLSESALKELGATLKSKCGTGGTVKDGRIEIQGDNRERVIAELTKLGYQVKRVGG